MSSGEDRARRLVNEAVEALRQWRRDIDALNQRNLIIAMDRIDAAQQAMGWPNRVTAETGLAAVPPGKMHYFMVLDSVREQLLKSSQEDMHVIDKVAEACFASLQPQRSPPSGAPRLSSEEA